MTREETIQLLRNWDGYFIGHGSDDVNEALDIAIKALEQKSCEDAISREAAIEAVIDLCKYYTPTKSVNHPHMDFVIEELQNLPSVTPQQPCENAVSREEVKREIRRWLGYLDEDMISRINMGIDRLPSVTPIIPEVEIENNYNIGYNCGYADAMSDVADMRGEE